MKVHLIDGTYELFRAHYGAPPATGVDGRQVGATRGLLRSLLALLREDGVTHVAIAFDHVIESFRNDLYEGYKTGAAIDSGLMRQFSLAERAAHALGVVVWPMTVFEADDALATASARFAADPSVDQVVICSPDKDLTQCVRDERIVCLDRRREVTWGEDGVRRRFGVSPESIPDYLALVGDGADGFPGVRGWGAKSAATVLARYRFLESIPSSASDWDVTVRGAARLARNLEAERSEAALFKKLATLRYDVSLEESVADLEWVGARREELESLCRDVADGSLPLKVPRWRSERSC